MIHNRLNPLMIIVSAIGLSVVVYLFAPQFVWINEPLHSTMEAWGGAVAIGTSLIFISFYDLMGENKSIAAVSLGLLSMGIFDAYHAAVSVGQGFVWLHSMAVFAGGLVTIVSLLLAEKYLRRRQVLLSLGVGLVSLAIGLFSVVFYQYLPTMVQDGQFTFTAYLLNFTGGSGFLIASYLVWSKRGSDSPDWMSQITVLLVLLGLSGIVFEFSAIWDATWWWWHLLRVIAFLAALGIVFQFLINASSQLSSQSNELEMANRSLTELSNRDGLTNLYNRRAFDQRLLEDVNRQQRSSGAFSLLMIDIDFFKQYNDHYGHQSGDDVLISVSRCLEQQASRSEDMVARYGGEEFVVLLPGVNHAGAMEVSGCIHTALEQVAIPHEKSKVASWVTVSIGCFSSERLSRDVGASDVVAVADQNLYAAKQNGRAQTASGTHESNL